MSTFPGLALGFFQSGRARHGPHQHYYEAIGERRVLAFSYKGSARTAEPYIVGYDDKNKLVLSAVQLSGGSGIGFRSFDVDDMSSVAKTDRRFNGSHPKYNPGDPYFARILKQV